MGVYISLLVLLVLCTLVTIDKDKSHSFFFFFILSTLIISLPAFRSFTVGTDTINYVKYYLLPNAGYNNSQDIEIGYRLFSDFLRTLRFGVYPFIFVNAVFSVGAVIWFIFKFSKYRVFSLFLFCTAGVTNPFYFSYFSGMRQIMAIGFFLFALGLYVKENRNWLEIFVFVLLSVSFHVSAIVILPVFFIHRINFAKHFGNVVIIGSFFLGFALSKLLFELSDFINIVLGGLFGFENKGGYFSQIPSSLHQSNLVMIMLPFSLLGLLVNNYSSERIRSSVIFKVFVFGLVLNNLFVYLPIAFRIVFYFVLLFVVVAANFVRDKDVPLFVRYGFLFTSLLYFSYKYFAVLTNMPFNEGNIIVPYSINLFL